jgi:hypothetical protein
MRGMTIVLVSEGCGAVRLQSDDAKKQADFADPETLSPGIFPWQPTNARYDNSVALLL